MAGKSKLQRSLESKLAATLDLETARITKAATAQPMNKYDVLEQSASGLRRKASAEHKGESSIYDLSRRMKGCNLGRDLERNYSPAKGIIHQFRVNVVGSLGKLRVNLPDGAGDAAGEYFNEVWAKDCDMLDDCDFSTMLQSILASVIREGDAAILVDDDIFEDSGKMRTWESDQITTLAPEAFKRAEYKGEAEGDVQDGGIIRSKSGIIKAYILSSERGLVCVSDPKKVTIMPRGEARLVKNPWRLNQGRGVPSIITSASQFIDLYEMLGSELQTAKRASKQYANVYRKDAVTDYDNPPVPRVATLPENSVTGGDGTGAEGGATAKNYENLELYTGGFTDYLSREDRVEFAPADRPNANLAAFMDAINGQSGAALGMAFAYTRMRADSSYTAFRGDMIMTWVTFRWLQKWLERTVCDWTAVRVLRWAQRKQRIKTLPEGWETALSWMWPKMPEVNEGDAQKAIAEALKNGTTDYSEQLGPDWRKRLEGFAEMVDAIRLLNLPLGILEGKSGGAVAVNEPANTDNTKGATK